MVHRIVTGCDLAKHFTHATVAFVDGNVRDRRGFCGSDGKIPKESFGKVQRSERFYLGFQDLDMTATIRRMQL